LGTVRHSNFGRLPLFGRLAACPPCACSPACLAAVALVLCTRSLSSWAFGVPSLQFAPRGQGRQQRIGAMRAWTCSVCVLLSVCGAYSKTVADNPAFMIVGGISGVAEMCLAAANGA